MKWADTIPSVKTCSFEDRFSVSTNIQLQMENGCVPVTILWEEQQKAGHFVFNVCSFKGQFMLHTTELVTMRNVWSMCQGKSRIGREVASIFGAVLMSTPPKCLQDIRYKFDSRSETLRRAYYALGNYIAGWEVEILIKTKPVFMDRFWHSTTAYTVAQEISQGNLSLPNLGDPIYMWPKDLVRPNKVFFLEVDEETRNKRMARRRQTVTSEELQLKDSNTFRTSLVETYKRMMVPSIIQVDANRKVAEVVQEVASTLKPLFPDRKIESIMK